MKSKLLEVKEFESITNMSEDKTEYGNHKIPAETFQDLVRFIHEFAADEDHADALDFMKIGCKRNVGDYISVKNYVGLIQMKNGYQVQILPKIDLAEQDDNNELTKRIFLKMLRTMKDFPSKVLNDASLKVDKMNLYEIFINMYLQEIRQLVKRGIRSSYVGQEDNLRYYKGKLLVSPQVKTNFAHKERFYVAFDEFHPNRAENRLIKATLEKLQRITTSAQNSKEIGRLLTAFEMVDPSKNIDKDFSKVVIDRSTKDYELLMQWSDVFLRNKSFTTFSGSTTSRALLFPMESVYESYVARMMRKVFTPEGWSVSSQDKGLFLFTEPRDQFRLRPDIVLRRGEQLIVMDTKWKTLNDNENKNYGISQSDMYQMYAYSKKYGTGEIWLLYPKVEALKGKKDIFFNSGDGTTVHVFMIDVENIEDSLLELREALEVSTLSES